MTAPSLSVVPKGDTAEAVKFLLDFYRDQPIVLTAIEETGMHAGAHTMIFDGTIESQITDMRKWIASKQGVANLYFTVNPVINPNSKKKPLKNDIRGAKWLHVDVDPRAGEDIDSEKQRAIRLAGGYAPPPNLIIDSGNGIQLLWRLAQEYSTRGDAGKITEIEGRNRKIALDFSGDLACYNIDRILRVPGTVNVPTKKKLQKGRVPVDAKLISFDPTRAYDLSDFQSIDVTAKGAEPDKIAEMSKTMDIPEKTELNDVPGMTDELKHVAIYGEHPAQKDRWLSRSEMLFWWVIQCRLNSIPQNVIVSILLDPRLRISDSIREKRNPKEHALRQVTRAEQKGGISDKPIIEVKIDNIEDVLNKAEAAVTDAGIEIFQSHGALVRLVSRGDKDPPSITEVRSHWLLEKFISCAKWVKRSGRELKAFEPKVNIANHYIDREGEWRIPILNGIVMTPTLRKDLTLLSEPGYDRKSGLFFMAGGMTFLPIPENPTREDAMKALELLAEPFRCFPFVPDKISYQDEEWIPDDNQGKFPSVSRSVVLSSMITGVIRTALATAPMHAIDAPEKGTGKGLIADCVAILVTGYPAVMMSLGNDETEDRKRMFSTLAAGSRVIVIDNVERALQGDALCTILTQEVWQDRVLGQSKMESVSTNALFMATGNNLKIVGDMTRRVIICRMDARSERPDERKFTFDPRKLVKENRAELINACLIIILAYLTAGRPYTDKLKAMGSFDDWSIVREALMWLDQPDPAMSRDRIRNDDSARMIVSEMMEMWSLVYQTSERRLLDVYAGLTQQGLDQGTTHLRDLCSSFCQSNRLNMRDLRRWFERNSNKIVGKRRFVLSNDSSGTMIRLESGLDEPDTIAPEEETKF